MAEDIKDILQEDHRPAILKELDSFNTAEGFGMLGILNEQLGNDDKPETPEKEETEKPEVERKEQPATDAYAPLNSSIQDLASKLDMRFTDVERQLAEQRNMQQQRAQQQEQPQIQYDPDEPLTRAHLAQYENRVRQSESLAYQSSLENSRLQAHIYLDAYKRQRPDFSLSPQELDYAFRNAVGNDLNKARSINWQANFDQLYNRHILPARETELSNLRKENEVLKEQLKTRKPTKAEAVSPAVARSTTRTAQPAISSPTNFEGDEVVNMREFKKGASFKSFGNALKRIKGIG